MLSGLLGALQEVALPQRHLGTPQNYLEFFKERLSHLAAAILAWFLTTVICRPFLQDILLALPACRALILRTFRHRFQYVIDVARRSPTIPAKPFEYMDYYVDKNAAQVLQFAALHALSAQLQASEPLPPTQLLPSVSHVLLQNEDRRGTKYLEAVAGNLASQIGASLVLVDGMLLASLLAEALGGGPELYIDLVRSGGAEKGGRSQRRLRFAWEALAQSLPHSGGSRIGGSGGGSGGSGSGVGPPTVVYLRSVDSLICASVESFMAFMDIFGPQSGESMAVGIHTTPPPPVLLIGGVILEETGAAVVGQGGNSLAEGGRGVGGFGAAEQSSTRHPFKSILGDDSNPLGAGMDDDLSLANLLLSLSRMGEEPKPDPRRLLPKAFPTRVKLSAPPSGPTAARHLARLQADEADSLRTDNYSRASAVAAATGVRLPGKSCKVYATEQRTGGSSSGGSGGGGGDALTKEDWEKVLAWAVSMESLQRHKEAAVLLAAQKDLAAEEAEIEGAVDDIASKGTVPVLLMKEKEEEEEYRVCGSNAMRQELRRRVLVPSGDGGMRRVMSAAEHSDTYWTEDISNESLRKKKLAVPSSGQQHQSLSLVSLMYSAVNGIAQRIFPGLFNTRRDDENREEGNTQDIASPSAINKNSNNLLTEAPALPEAVGPMYISEAALRYGLAMLHRSGGAIRPTISPENQYEKQLLCEVLYPESLGGGFRDIGALDDAKRALRDAVQLPLLRPELFEGGALSAPPKGVLLFGPPGTGKTLLARATAAESGASFLELSLSSVASKWFGDSTRLVRAAFSLAAKLAPCVIFIDEVDALLGRRSSGGREHEASREMKNEFMQRWDGIRGDAGKRVVVMGATNRPFDLDDAVLRRFGVRVAVDLPQKSARKQILKVVLAGQALAPDVELDQVAERSEGFSGADLRQLCVAAAMRPVRELLGDDMTNTGDGGSSSSSSSGLKELNSGGEISYMNNQEEEGDKEVAGNRTDAPLTEALLGSSVSVYTGALALAEQLGDGSGGLQKASPRPVSAADFEAARKKVGPTVDQDSSVVQELKEWNNKYGSVGQRGGDGKQLSYYT